MSIDRPPLHRSHDPLLKGFRDRPTSLLSRNCFICGAIAHPDIMLLTDHITLAIKVLHSSRPITIMNRDRTGLTMPMGVLAPDKLNLAQIIFWEHIVIILLLK
jgi:hypothetical protein